MKNDKNYDLDKNNKYFNLMNSKKSILDDNIEINRVSTNDSKERVVIAEDLLKQYKLEKDLAKKRKKEKLLEKKKQKKLLKEQLNNRTVSEAFSDFKEKRKRILYENQLENEKRREYKKDLYSSNYINSSIIKNYRLRVLKFSILVFIVIFSTIFAIINLNNTKIAQNIYINNINVSNKSIEEAREILVQNLNKNYVDFNINSQNFKLFLDNNSILDSIDKKINEAYEFGRSNNIFLNNYQLFFNYFIKKDFHFDLISDNEINRKIEEIEENLNNQLIQPSYSIINNKLIINKGTSGILVDKSELFKFLKSGKDFSINLKTKNPHDVDIYKIHSEIKSSPSDAYIVDNKLISDKNGIDFDIDLAKKLISSNNNEVEIPLIITDASVKISDLGEKAYVDTLGTFTTFYDASNTNRTNNIEIASNSINGQIINSGEVFSFNDVLGKRTLEKGYRDAKAYANNKIVLDVGGGICQVSSTLYNSALTAGLEIVERHNHRFITSYTPIGQDATVSWGAYDFKFKNTNNFPIKIISNSDSGVLKIEILGIKDGNKEFIITSKIVEELPFETKYIQDKSLPKNSELVDQDGINGYVSNTFIKSYENGVLISERIINNDSYHSLPKIIYNN